MAQVCRPDGYQRVDVLACMAFPKAHWTQIHQASLPERSPNSSTRRSNSAQTLSAFGHSYESLAVMPSFPNDAVIIWLVGALLTQVYIIHPEAD